MGSSGWPVNSSSSPPSSSPSPSPPSLAIVNSEGGTAGSAMLKYKFAGVRFVSKTWSNSSAKKKNHGQQQKNKSSKARKQQIPPTLPKTHTRPCSPRPARRYAGTGSSRAPRPRFPRRSGAGRSQTLRPAAPPSAGTRRLRGPATLSVCSGTWFGWIGLEWTQTTNMFGMWGMYRWGES
jgi:hypothetical protein